MYEYGVPEDWESITEEELKALRATCSSALEAEDLGALSEFKGEGSAASGSAGQAAEKTELQKLNETIDTLKNNLPQEIAKYQAMVLKVKLIKTKAEGPDAKYHAALIADCAKLVSQGTRLTKILERMALEEPNEGELPKVIGMISDTDKKLAIVDHWADKHGFLESDGAGAKKRKRTNKSSDD